MRQLVRMMTTALCCAVLTCLAGCAEKPKSEPAAQATPPAPPMKPAAAPAQTGDKAPAGDEAKTETAAADKTDAAPKKTADDAEMADDEKEMEADDADLVEKAPADMDREELISAMMEKLQTGILKARVDQLDDSDAAIRESAVFAEELKKRFPDLAPIERRVSSIVFLHYARALLRGETPAEAANAIQTAIEMGFDDLERLDEDESFAKLKEAPDYETLRKGWEARINEQAAAEIQKELAEFKSYPFDFDLPDLDDKPVKLADHAGKVLIVDIWGTWCPPCRAEVPSFIKLQEKYGEQGLQIIGINYEQTEDREEALKLIREFLEAEPINYPLVFGNDATREQVPDFEGFPTTLFIDRTGKVRLQYVGLHTYGRLEATVLALLNDGKDAAAPAEEKPAEPAKTEPGAESE